MFTVTYQYLGDVPAARYQRTDVPTAQAHERIGANAVSGFTPVVHTTTVTGEPLATRDGRPLTVVAIHGSIVWGAYAFEA